MMQASTEQGATIARTVQTVLREEGVRAFWKGNGTNGENLCALGRLKSDGAVLKIMPESGVKFYANDYFKGMIIRDPDNVTATERLLAGSCAGVTAQSLIYPMEVVKTRLALAERGVYSGIAGCFSKIARTEGLAGLYRGLAASNVGIIPYAGVDLAVYGTLKARWFDRYGHDCKPQWYHLLLMGAGASFTGQVVAYPLQLIRTKLQSSGLPGRPEYSGIGHVFSEVMRAEGPLGFYRGIAANFMKGIPAVAIGYVAYEQSIELLSQRFD